MNKNIQWYFAVSLFSFSIFTSPVTQLRADKESANAEILPTDKESATDEIKKSDLSEEEKLEWLKEKLGGSRFETNRVAAFIASEILGLVICEPILFKTFIFYPVLKIAMGIAIHNEYLAKHGVEKKTSFFLFGSGAPFYALFHEFYLGYHMKLNDLVENYKENEQDIPLQFKPEFDALYRDYKKNDEIKSMNKNKQVLFVAKILKKIQKDLDHGNY